MAEHHVQAHTLSNGLLVLTKELHTAPIATCWVWYRVGSRNEPGGHTGISHWVEHMLFKGTPTIGRGELDRMVARNGGTFNGFTGVDYTAYYETLPADRIELALQIESDRMVNALFDPKEVERERTVILSELEGYANYPETWLDEAVRAAAFTAHPYHNPVIGYANDLHHMNRTDLYQHYQTFYMPNNAVLVLAGDFQTGGMLAQVERYFAHLPVGPALPKMHAVEPEPQGERRVVIRRPGPAHYVQIGFLATDCRGADFMPLTVLDAVLSGPGGLTGGGGGQTNRSARIYRALIETELASSASSYYRPSIDPHLFEFEATARENQPIETVEQALLHEIEKIQQDGISKDELAKVRKQVRAQFAYANETISNQAMALGMWEVLDSYQRVATLLDELNAVQVADVQRVAQTYLNKRRRTIGYFIPTEE
jgi:zinc protease